MKNNRITMRDIPAIDGLLTNLLNQPELRKLSRDIIA